MPNWCSVAITITGPVDTIRALHEGAVDGKLCNTVYPVPQMLVDTVSGTVGQAGSDKQLSLEEQERFNTEMFSYKNWYDFCVNEWGVKWDFGNEHAAFTDNGNGTATLTVSDETAWSPPIAILEKMHDQGLDVLAYYYEPGMAFCGKWENGNDECYNITGNSEWVDNNIPDDINETFEISEQMAQWEEA